MCSDVPAPPNISCDFGLGDHSAMTVMFVDSNGRIWGMRGVRQVKRLPRKRKKQLKKDGMYEQTMYSITGIPYGR